MTPIYEKHAEVVEAWVGRLSPDLSADQLIQVFDQTFAFLWRQARTSVNAVILAAVLERVLFNSAESQPLLDMIQVTETGPGFERLRKSAPTLDANEIIKAFQLMITEFFAIVGSLTNQVLTPRLHAELLKIKPEKYSLTAQIPPKPV